MTTIAQLEAPEARDAGRLVAELDIQTHAWIDGKPVEALSGESFPRINPATGVATAPTFTANGSIGGPSAMLSFATAESWICAPRSVTTERLRSFSTESRSSRG